MATSVRNMESEGGNPHAGDSMSPPPLAVVVRLLTPNYSSAFATRHSIFPASDLGTNTRLSGYYGRQIQYSACLQF